MKTILTTASALALSLGAGAVLADGQAPQDERREVRVIAGDGDDRTIEIRNGEVYVDGERIETDGESAVIIENDEVRVIPHGDRRHLVIRDGRHHAEHSRRMAEHVAHARVMAIELDGMEGEVRAQLEAALAGLDDVRPMHGEDWDELSEEEREEIREALLKAREEIHEAMSEMHIEMAELREERAAVAHEMRELHVELEALHGEEAEVEEERRRIIIEMREVEREAAREARDEAREIAREAREEARRAREEARRSGGEFRLQRQEERVRIEEDDEGRRRVWVNGEEQTGDDLTDWLNRLEAGELAGGAPGGEGRFQRRIVRYGEGDHEMAWAVARGDGGHIVIDIDGETIDLAELADGERNVFIRRSGDGMSWGSGDGEIVIELDGETIDLAELADSAQGHSVFIRRGDAHGHSWTSAEDGEFIIQMDGEVIDLEGLEDEEGVMRWESEDGQRVMIIRRNEERRED